MEARKEYREITIKGEVITVEMPKKKAEDIISALRGVKVMYLNSPEKTALRELSVALAKALGK